MCIRDRAHGTPDPSNAYYSVIQDRIHTLGMKNVFVYTVEGTPNLEQVIPQLKLHGIKHVTLMPFMMVAGDHANNDMAEMCIRDRCTIEHWIAKC